MKKFLIKDEDGTEFEVQEIEKKEEEVVPTQDEFGALSEDEISALKRLASVADKLIALTETTDEDIKEEVKEVIEDEDEDDEDEIVEEDKEEIIDTDEVEEDKNNMHDSINSIGSKISTNDSVDIQTDIANAWANRYKGGNR